MWTKKLFCLIGLVLLIFGGCIKQEMLWVGIAEDQTGSLSIISKDLDQGRKLSLQLLSQQYGEKIPLRLKIVDTMNSPEKTANGFRMLRDQHQVGLFLGVPSSECAHIAKHVAELRQIPFICNAYEVTLPYNLEWVSVFRQNPLQLGQLTALYFFYVMKKNRLAVLYDEVLEATVQSAHGYLKEGRIIGATMLEDSFSSFERPVDWQVSLSRIQSAQPEVVLIAADPSYYKDLLIIARQVLKITSIFVLHHQPLPEDLQTDPELFHQAYVLTPFYSEKEVFTKSQFYQQYLQRFNEIPTFYSAQGHDEVVFLHEILKKRNQLVLNERFRNLEGFIADKKYFTGFRGFMDNGLSVHEIDVLKIEREHTEYLGNFWMEILSKGNME